MFKKRLKNTFCIWVIMQMNSSALLAQNLLANPSFEAINVCVEYLADCAPEAWYNIPAGNFLVKAKTAPQPYFGNMVLIVPFGSVMANFNKPRFVYTGLCCPLQKDKKYLLSFYINTANEDFKQLAVYFTDKEPTLSSINKLSEIPSLIITKENLGERRKNNWQMVQINYTAKGNEHFFIFTTRGLLPVEYNINQAMNKSGDVLYFIDEVNLSAVDSVSLCSNYESNIDKMFAYNYRHTNDFSVFNEALPAKPAVKFINDTIVIPGLLFDINKSVVKPAVAKILDSIKIVLQQRNYLQINITGHTDSTGLEKNNLLLSNERATAIKNYLAQKLSVDKIAATGKGSAVPVATNTTAAGRQRNRRVQIIITYTIAIQ